eukprot:gnl/MRDRNA2_/MRDRNA2_28030_c0_seq1.p1 gnl/MRDRNA2_/MRDRNA2_28030_c0~~gnl/MRDRNA2_/MRDRNA2_28030_c0_seq1.p1  ORF type:complete len:447 (-),score=91.68 gnl/MRDRNA2_/MRDRNA2_28030_c0_seq1:8-1348(-)
MLDPRAALREDATMERDTAEVKAALTVDPVPGLGPQGAAIPRTGPSELASAGIVLDADGHRVQRPTTTFSQGSTDLLPEAEFTYIDRPWEHFTGRWKAIEKELRCCFGDSPFTMVDLGSCSGYFSLQTAANFSASNVVGVEGSVGIGNGTVGVSGNGKRSIMETKAVQTHARWIDRLGLGNCHIGVEVWDFARVDELARLGRPICDVILMLSVVHHIDGISAEMYAAQGLTKVQGTVLLLARLMELAPRVIIELPDRPWIEHVHDAYGTQRKILEAAVQMTNAQWSFKGPLFLAEWYGQRELWMLERVSPVQKDTIPAQNLCSLFPCLVGSKGQQLSQASIREVPQSRSVGQMVRPQQYGTAAAAAATPPVDPLMGELLCNAPTELLAAHFNLRTAVEEAEALLHEVRVSGFSGNQGRSQSSLQAPAGMATQAQTLGAQVQPIAAC